ncbi:MAG: Rne/Rng family ribonuclease [Myxococcota bacterium]
MTEKLLINVAHEETRVALVESGRLTNFEIVTSRADNNKGNIYKGIVHRVNASLQAAFVDYGAEKQGFLPVGEIHTRYYPKHLQGKKAAIQEVLQQGAEIMVQIVKDEIGQKGATLTTFVSLAGRSLALEADSDKAGISRRVSDTERTRLKKVMNSLEVPEGFGAIMRTAAADQGEEDIKENQKYLMSMWNQLQDRFRAMKGPGLVHQERSLPLRFIRDYVAGTVDEILIDDRETFDEVRNFCTVTAPELVGRVKLYDDPRPLFSRYQIEDQIDDLFARKIELPSGGSIVIDQAEALVAIDVNSGRVKTDDIEDTATKTNLEAAAEIARQLKIRDRGGLIVVDFIDMRDKDNIRKVEDAVREGFRTDKAKVKFSKISEFGLMEISRQRLQSSVVRGSFSNCPSCGGTGLIRSVESSSLYLLRRMKETLIRGNYQHLEARMPVAVANYLLNQKRRELVDLEKQSGAGIEVVAEHECPPMKAWIELLARATTQARKPRRVVQEIDLVRSEVEKRDLEEGEQVLIEQLTHDVAEPSQFAEEKAELDQQNKAMEAELAKARAVELAQREADESLRRESEARAEAEKKLAEAEKIRALDEARRKSLSLWGRIRAFFYGLPPIDEPRAGGAAAQGSGDGGPRVERERERERDRDRRDRDDRRKRRDDKKPDGAKPPEKAGEKPAVAAGAAPSPKPEGRGDRHGEKRHGERGDRPERAPGERPDHKRGERPQGQGPRPGQPPQQRPPMEGAAPGGDGADGEGGRKRRRRRGRGGRDDGPEMMDGAPGEEGAPRAEGEAGQPAGARPPGEPREPRGDRPPREPRPPRDDRPREDRPQREDGRGRPERAPAAASVSASDDGQRPSVAVEAPPAIPGDSGGEPLPKPKLPKVGVIDLRAGAPRATPVPPAPAPVAAAPAPAPAPVAAAPAPAPAPVAAAPAPAPVAAAPAPAPAAPAPAAPAVQAAAAPADDGDDDGPDDGGGDGDEVDENGERKRRRGRRGGRGRRRQDGAPAGGAAVQAGAAGVAAPAGERVAAAPAVPGDGPKE